MKRASILSLLSLVIVLMGCTPTSIDPPVLRIGLLPILDALPIHAADSLGYFEEEGLEVRIIPVASGAERDQLMQSGQIDAMINELVSVMLFNQQSTRVTAVRYARTATADTPLFQILVAPGAAIRTADDLRGIDIGISEGTVIEYATTRMLEAVGFDVADIAMIAVPKIPDRLNLLLGGQLQAATLPEPAVSVAVQQGARVILDDTLIPELSSSLITFDQTYLEANPELVRAFLRAVERAVEAIHTNPNAWDELLVDRNLLSLELVDQVQLPRYPLAGVPEPVSFADTLLWAQSSGYVNVDIAYEACVTDDYLP